MSRRLERDDKKPLNTQKKLLWAALSLCICIIIASSVYLGRYYIQIFAQKNIDKEVNDKFVPHPMAVTESPSPAGTDDPTPDDAAPPDDGDSEWDKERSRRLELEKLGREINADLLDDNSDFLGMISIPGLNLKKPYVKSWDNDEYLHRDFYGKNSQMGTIFLNCRNDRLLMDRNTIMYGHNIKGGEMFSKLLDYKNANTFKKAPVIILDSLIGESVWVVFAAHVIEPDWWGYDTPDPNREVFAEMLEEIKQRSLFITDTDVNENDQILTLSTCDYTHEDMRFAVYARRLRPGEEAPDSVAAEKNPDQKPYNIPNQMKLSSVKANRAAIVQTSGRMYFYQPFDGGINWYAGNTSTVQGLYQNYSHKGINKDSFIAAVYDSGTDTKRLYVAVENFNGQQGITLFTNRLPSGDLLSNGLITPSGVDAKRPALVCDSGGVWLLYTVAQNGGEEIYRRKLQDGKAAGEPELLRTVPSGSGTRPLGVYDVDGTALLFWHEAANKKVYCAWEGEEPHALQLTGDADRVTLYGTVSGSSLKAATEKGGNFSFVTIDINNLPGPPSQPPDPEPEPSGAPEPSGDSAGDGDPDMQGAE